MINCIFSRLRVTVRLVNISPVLRRRFGTTGEVSQTSPTPRT